MNRFSAFILLLLMLAGISSCRKQTFITSADAKLLLADSVRFDTVFSTVGSVTQYFTIVNNNLQKLRLSSVKLMGGNTSPYRININGIATTEITNLEMEAGDSVYVFVSVTVDPGSDNQPFLVKDSIQVNYNGNQRYIQLEAYGQNAHFLKNHIINADMTWNNDLPYVVSGGILVEEGVTLTIEKGCRIYMHANAPLIIDGTLIVNGTKTDSVTFQGDRLDKGYRDLPASWPGLIFRTGSHSNTITYAIIKNAYQSVVCAGPSGNALPKLQLNECIIDNIYDIGIWAKASSISAVNCLVSNCGLNILLEQGGAYDFTHCTIASYGNTFIEHKRPVVSVSNTDEQQQNSHALNVLFRNCIIWGDAGNVEDELQASRTGSEPFDLLLDHSLFKAKSISPEITMLNSIVNQDPAFDSIHTGRRYFDFHIGQKASPAIGAGTATSITTDLDGRLREGIPDQGCYMRR
ncbi:MAG: hypothetical protein KF862_24575 [Chitinophagaceae bacterium]|nr:hypothetical protein [Chitinophagaceae bacterium]